MSLARPAFVIPTGALPDGTVSWEGHVSATGTIEALREYDDRLALVRNFEKARWEIWRTEADGRQHYTGFCSPQERIPDGNQLVAILKAHDQAFGYDPVAAVIADEAAADKAAADEFDAQMDEAGDKLHHALARDLGMPAARPMALGGR